MNTISLKYRIAITIFVLEAVMLALVLWQTLGISYETERNQLTNAENMTLNLLGDLARTARITSEYPQLQARIENLQRDRNIKEIIVADAGRRIVVSTAIVQIGALMQELEDTGENYWRTKDIDSDAGSLGVLAIQFSTEVLTQSYHKARNFGVVMAISGMVFIAIVGLFMGHVLTRRLNSVVTAARRIANGDYAVSAGVTGRDEIADMGKAFEHMAGEIQKNIAQLAKSEERYRSLIEQASDGIFVTDAKGNYMDVNTSGCRMLGYDKDELLKLNIMGVIPADDLKSDPIQFAELMKGKTIVRERRLKRKDGSLLQVEVSANMLSEDRIMAIVRDITERKQAEEALRSSEEKFSKAFHHSPDAINIVGLKDGRIIEINDGFTSIFGYTSEEVKNKTTVDLQLWANPADRKKVVELLEKDGYVRDFQSQARTKSGKLLDCLFSAANIDLEGDKCLVTTTRDITERKQAEEALRSSEEKFSKAFHSSPDIIGINSIPDGRIIEVNEAFEKITGFRREEVIGKTTVELNVWANPEDRDRYYQEIKQRGKVRNMEVGFRIKNQEVKTALISAESIKFEGHACLLFVIKDITERKLAHQALQASEARYRNIFETAGVSLWEQDFSEIKAAIDKLKKFRVKNFRKYFDRHPEFVERAAQMVRVLNCNQAALSIYEASSKEELLTSLDKVFTEESFEVFREELVAIAEGRTLFQAETKNQTLKGRELDILISMRIPSKGDPFDRLILAIDDITERKQAERALRESLSRTKALFEYAAIVIWEEDFSEVKRYLDKLQKKGIDDLEKYFREHPDEIEHIAGLVVIKNVNRKSLEFYHASSKAELNKFLPDWFMEESLQVFREEIVALAGGADRFENEIPVRTPQGEIKYLHVNLAILPDHKEPWDQVFVSFIDVTERKQAERELQKTSGQLRALAAHLQSVREEERTAIAREMHDELGQVLTVLKMDLAMLKKEVNRGPEHKIAANLSNEINAMMTLVDTTIKKVRTLITELRPEVLDTLGLISALEWQAEEFKQRTDINSTFKTDAKEIEFDKDLSIAVFRIVQEALTNVARHSKARQVDIHLTKNNGFLELKIRDDGVGFSKNKLDNDKTFGVLGMKERALILGGEVQIEATEGRGTTVKARIPIR